MINYSSMESEIKRYYAFSNFINKYIIIITSFLLSLFMVIVSNTSSVNVLAYSTNINMLEKQIKITKQPYRDNILSARFNLIDSDIVLKPAVVGKDTINLGYGIYIKGDYYFPSNIKFKKLNLKVLLKTKKFNLNNYIGFLKLAEDGNIKFIKPFNKNLENAKVLEKYNLSCINSFLSNTKFCDYNKYFLLRELLSKNIDISSSFYTKLFNSLNETNEEKCDIVLAIYFKKFNYTNIKDVLSKYCTNEDIEKVKKAEELLKVVGTKQVFKIKKDYNYINVYLTQLINQFYVILHKKTISSDVATSTVSLIKKGLENNYFDKTMAKLAVYMLDKQIKPKLTGVSKTSAIYNDIKTVLNGDNILGFKGLLAIAGTLNEEGDNLLLVDNTKTYVSKIEIFKDLVNRRYKNELVLTSKIKSNSKTNTLKIKANVVLIYDINGKITTYSVPVYFYTTKISDGTFNIKGFRILDKKVSTYLGTYKRTFDNFDSLYEYLKSKLKEPVFTKSWTKQKNKSSFLSICDKVKDKTPDIYCQNGIIKLSAKDLKYKGDLELTLYLDKDLKVKKVLSNNGYIYLDTEFNEKVKITDLVIKFINSRIQKNTDQDYVADIVYIKSIIKKYLKLQLDKLVGLKDTGYSLLDLKQRFSKIGAKNLIVRKVKKDIYKVYFTIKDIKMMALYNLDKNEIIELKLYKELDKMYSCSGFKLQLSNVNSEILNGLKFNTLKLLKSKCPSAVKQYLK